MDAGNCRAIGAKPQTKYKLGAESHIRVAFWRLSVDEPSPPGMATPRCHTRAASSHVENL